MHKPFHVVSINTGEIVQSIINCRLIYIGHMSVVLSLPWIVAALTENLKILKIVDYKTLFTSLLRVQ